MGFLYYFKFWVWAENGSFNATKDFYSPLSSSLWTSTSISGNSDSFGISCSRSKSGLRISLISANIYVRPWCSSGGVSRILARLRRSCGSSSSLSFDYFMKLTRSMILSESIPVFDKSMLIRFSFDFKKLFMWSITHSWVTFGLWRLLRFALGRFFFGDSF